MVCKRLFLSGKVQGVSFRYHAHEMATKFKVNGWVRNLDDGRLELVVAGDEKSVAQMIKWASKGPPQAEVKKVEEQDFKNIPDEPFYIRRDTGK